jgi:hypothetical protein
VWVYMCVRIEESVCVCLCTIETQGQNVCVCVCVCVTSNEREKIAKSEKVFMCEIVNERNRECAFECE